MTNNKSKIKSVKTPDNYIVSIGVKNKKQAFTILAALSKVAFYFTSRIDEPPIILSNPKEEEF